MKVLRYPVYPAGWKFFDLAATAATTARSSSSTTRSGSSAATTSVRRTPTEWRDTHVRITGPGVWDLKRAFADFWNLNRRRRIGHVGAAAAPRDLVDVGVADPLPPQRAAAVDVPDPVDVHRGDQPRVGQRLDDARLLLPRPGLRRRDEAGRGPRGRRTSPAAAEVQPHRGRLDLARLLLPAAQLRRPDLPLQGRDGARQDVDHRRDLVDGRHGERRPAQPPGQLRDQRRGDRRGVRAGARGDLPRRRVELPRADAGRSGKPATCTASSPR